MPYRKMLNALFESKKILGCIIINPSGDIWWHYGFFPQNGNKQMDGYFLLSEWVTYPQNVQVAGVNYISFINSYPNYWILISTNDIGYLIIQKADNGYYFICYIPNDLDPLLIQKEISNMAKLFK
ncbi:MAG: hypothetical protein ACTSR2_08590 [Candidatus Hodarchaeales archaeon]